MSLLKQTTHRVGVFSLALVIAIVTFTGCSSNSSSIAESNTTVTTPTTTLSLVIGEEVEVYKSDEVKPEDSDTEISVRHLLGSDKKYVTLLSGSAELIRGESVVE